PQNTAPRAAQQADSLRQRVSDHQSRFPGFQAPPCGRLTGSLSDGRGELVRGSGHGIKLSEKSDSGPKHLHSLKLPAQKFFRTLHVGNRAQIMVEAAIAKGAELACR